MVQPTELIKKGGAVVKDVRANSGAKSTGNLIRRGELIVTKANLKNYLEY